MKNFIFLIMLPFLLLAVANEKTAYTKTEKINVPVYKTSPQVDSIIRFIPTTIGPYCPSKLLAGDREFGGHGPEIWSWIDLKIENKNVIVSTVYMHARETVSDWSETEGSWIKTIYTAPRGFEIAEIMSGVHSEVHYISRPGKSSFSPSGMLAAVGGQGGIDVPFKDDGLVTRWNIVGDTGGPDISDDNNCNDDTQVAIQLNPIKVKLRKIVKLKYIKPMLKPGFIKMK
jgi:hypothetical protein